MKHERKDDLDYEALDPGARSIVALLRRNGFDTTDSGDGASKPAEQRVFNCLHVACAVEASRMLAEADRLSGLLGEKWHIEANYQPGRGLAMLLATFEPDFPSGCWSSGAE